MSGEGERREVVCCDNFVCHFSGRCPSQLSVTKGKFIKTAPTKYYSLCKQIVVTKNTICLVGNYSGLWRK